MAFREIVVTVCDVAGCEEVTRDKPGKAKGWAIWSRQGVGGDVCPAHDAELRDMFPAGQGPRRAGSERQQREAQQQRPRVRNLKPVPLPRSEPEPEQQHVEVVAFTG